MADDIQLMDYMGGSDWIGIALAVVAAFFIGFVWFTFLFGKRWAAEFNMDMADGASGKEMIAPMLKDLFGNLLLAYVLWHSMMFAVPSVWADHLTGFPEAAANSGAWFYGLMTALFIWLGYFVPVALSRTGWEKRSWAWFGIDTGYHLVKLIAMGQILAAFASIP